MHSSMQPYIISFLSLGLLQPLVDGYDLPADKIEMEASLAKKVLENKELSGLNDALLELNHLSEAFPNLVRLIKIAMTIAVSTAQCERSFSKLKLLKNHLQSTMGDERLSNLAILSIKRELSDALILKKWLLNFLDWITTEGLVLFKLMF